jgi:hypothetical protein
VAAENAKHTADMFRNYNIEEGILFKKKKD